MQQINNKVDGLILSTEEIKGLIKDIQDLAFNQDGVEAYRTFSNLHDAMEKDHVVSWKELLDTVWFKMYSVEHRNRLLVSIKPHCFYTRL